MDLGKKFHKKTQKEIYALPMLVYTESYPQTLSFQTELLLPLYFPNMTYSYLY